MQNEFGALSENGITAGNETMVPLRFIIIGICIAIIMLDGFDVFAAAYTVPRIAREWKLTPDQAGILLSSGLIGMAAGTLFLSSLGDVFGRRRTVLYGVAIVGLAMLGAAAADDFHVLVTLRLCAGLGIGALSSIMAAVASETAPGRYRDLVLGLLTGGFSAGAILGGMLAAPLLETHGWRAVYLLGGVGAALLLPAAFVWLPESPQIFQHGGMQAIIGRRRREGRISNAAQAGLRTNPASARASWRLLAELMKSSERSRILLLVGCYTVCVAPIYFVNSWAPKLATGFGLSDSEAITVSVIQSAGSVLGGLLTGFLTARLGRRRLALLAMAAFILLLLTYPAVGEKYGAPGLRVHALLLGLSMFCSGIGMYAMIVEAFPAPARATGLGLAVGIARIGSSAGPYVGGLLLSAGLRKFAVCAMMTIPIFVSAVVFFRSVGRVHSDQVK